MRTRTAGLVLTAPVVAGLLAFGCSDRGGRDQVAYGRRSAADAPDRQAATDAGPVDPAALTVTPLVPDTIAVRGRTVTATFQARPGNSCQVEVRDAAGNVSHRPEPATANAQGLVSWTWTLNRNAVPGEATAMVVCSGGARGQATLEIG